MEVFEITIGALNNIAGFHRNSAKKYQNLIKECKNNKVPSQVVFDLTTLQSFQINLLALVAFLSISQKARTFLHSPIDLKLQTNRGTQHFLYHSGFYRATKRGIFNDIFNWPSNFGDINVDRSILTRVDSYDRIENIGSFSVEERNERKDKYRENSSNHIKEIFNEIEKKSKSFIPYKGILSSAMAELIVNSLLWGESHAFFGVQMSANNRITGCVCDAGEGTIRTIKKKHSLPPNLINLEDERSVAILSCILNTKYYGLPNAITEIIKLGGWVYFSGGKYEVIWAKESWEVVQQANVFSGNITKEKMDSICKNLIKLNDDKSNKTQFILLDYSLDGARVSFEIPANNTH